MKKTITLGMFVIIFLIGARWNMHAQELGLGLKIGADMNQIRGKSLKGNFKGYFMGGVQAHVRFGRIGLQLEGLLTQTQLSTGDNFYTAFGDYIKSTATSASNTEIILTELSFPLLMDFRLVGPVRGELGGQYSLIINAKDKNDYLVSAEQVVKDGYFSGLVGLKAEVLSFQVGVRYLQGFNNLNSTEVPERWNTGRFQVSLSYLLLH